MPEARQLGIPGLLKPKARPRSPSGHGRTRDPLQWLPLGQEWAPRPSHSTPRTHSNYCEEREGVSRAGSEAVTTHRHPGSEGVAGETHRASELRPGLRHRPLTNFPAVTTKKDTA